MIKPGYGIYTAIPFLVFLKEKRKTYIELGRGALGRNFPNFPTTVHGRFNGGTVVEAIHT